MLPVNGRQTEIWARVFGSISQVMVSFILHHTRSVECLVPVLLTLSLVPGSRK